jgi:hypothetical protein
MRRPLLIVALLFAAGAANTGVYAQGDSRNAVPTYRARILGVYDETSGEPVEGVRVLDIATGTSVETSKSGAVALFFLPDGGSIVRLQKIGYEAQTMPVAISPRDTSPITIIMRRVTELPTVVTKATETSHYISARLRGFEERSKKGFGTFIGDSVIRLNESRTLADLIKSRAPGINVMEGAGGRSYLLKSPHCTNGYPQVSLDGVILSPDPPPNLGTSNGRTRPVSMDRVPFDLSKFDLTSIAGIEWYPDNATAPIEFAHTSVRCGLLLLWTRER